MLDSSKTCVNCTSLFSCGKTPRRTALTTNIQHHDVSPLNVIHQVYAKHKKLRAISPDGKFVCQSCTSLLGKIRTGQKKLQEASAAFLSASSDNSYLSSKFIVTAEVSFSTSPPNHSVAKENKRLKRQTQKTVSNYWYVYLIKYILFRL